MSTRWNPRESFPRNVYEIDPSGDDNDHNLPQLMIVYCVEDGTVAAVNDFDVLVNYTLTSGQYVPHLVKRINSTGTSASLIGLY